MSAPTSSSTTTTTKPLARTSHIPLPPPAPYVPLRYPSSRKSIYDKNLNRTRQNEVSLSSFAHIFNSLISYHQARAPSVSDLESRLALSGYPIGVKMLDLLLYRQPQRSATRPTRLLELLQFIHTQLWRALFGRTADALELSSSSTAEYMITDNEPLVNTFISVPKDMSQLNCAAFVGGMIEGVCDAAGFATDSVTAHSAGEGDELWPGKTIFLIKFKKEIVEREEMLKGGS
ncbi:NO signaling/Golgi transport ligand-binding domain-containing protein [Elsinoe ampelina]|uniref:Trafficking protein particle complex subunit n=1 Tax=Elsinoe ampelina TaxID=302913 RepID=A0A6A6GJ51_9PEZI|nr:NO signaling/Golgi transport ligand-binding domain-containing protein [Elsinoe ampelina]